MRVIFLCFLLLFSGPALAAGKAQLTSADVPRYLPIGNLVSNGSCPSANPFLDNFWQKGVMGKKSRFSGSLTQVCRNKKLDWNGYRIRINWRDGKGRAYTDCNWKDNGPYQCWITVPN